MRYRRADVAGGSYFFTLVTENRRPLFEEPAAVALFLGAVEKVRARHPFEVDAYVVLPDHLHALWTLPVGDANFSTRWRLIKEGFTRGYLKTHEHLQRSESRRTKGEQGIWQRRFWEHAIRDEADFAAHLDYIHINPVSMGWSPPLAIGPTRRFRIGSRVAVMTSGGDRTSCRRCPTGSARNELVVPGQGCRLGRALARPNTSQFRMLGLEKNSTQPTSDL
jgi:putative transposase